MQFPTIMGGVVPVFNVKGIKAGQLKLTGDMLANIYLGKIKKWNDPAIQALNPGVKLPGQAISVVHRSDGSGTTFMFTNYLSKVSAGWKSTVGEGNRGAAGRPVSAAKATRAWRTTCSASPARSATSSTRTPSRTS